MNWNRNKSLQLSKFCVRLFFVILVAVVCGGPFLLVRWKDTALLSSYTIGQVYWGIVLSCGSAALCAGLALYHLGRLLSTIGKNEVFCAANVGHLRVLSWCCLLAGVCLLTGCWYAPTFWLLSAAAAFMGLILRVVKNVFAQALALKAENDLTI